MSAPKPPMTSADFLLRRFQRKADAAAAGSSSSSAADTSRPAVKLVETADGVYVMAAPKPQVAGSASEGQQKPRLPAASGAVPRSVSSAVPVARDKPKVPAATSELVELPAVHGSEPIFEALAATTSAALDQLLALLSDACRRSPLPDASQLLGSRASRPVPRFCLAGIETQAATLQSFLTGLVGGQSTGSALLLGPPGTGKRTLLRYCLHQAVQEVAALRAHARPQAAAGAATTASAGGAAGIAGAPNAPDVASAQGVGVGVRVVLVDAAEHADETSLLQEVVRQVTAGLGQPAAGESGSSGWSLREFDRSGAKAKAVLAGLGVDTLEDGDDDYDEGDDTNAGRTGASRTVSPAALTGASHRTSRTVSPAGLVGAPSTSSGAISPSDVGGPGTTPGPDAFGSRGADFSAAFAALQLDEEQRLNSACFRPIRYDALPVPEPDKARKAKSRRRSGKWASGASGATGTSSDQLTRHSAEQGAGGAAPAQAHSAMAPRRQARGPVLPGAAPADRADALDVMHAAQLLQRRRLAAERPGASFASIAAASGRGALAFADIFLPKRQPDVPVPLEPLDLGGHGHDDGGDQTPATGTSMPLDRKVNPDSSPDPGPGPSPDADADADSDSDSDSSGPLKIDAYAFVRDWEEAGLVAPLGYKGSRAPHAVPAAVAASAGKSLQARGAACKWGARFPYELPPEFGWDDSRRHGGLLERSEPQAASDAVGGSSSATNTSSARRGSARSSADPLVSAGATSSARSSGTRRGAPHMTVDDDDEDAEVDADADDASVERNQPDGGGSSGPAASSAAQALQPRRRKWRLLLTDDGEEPEVDGDKITDAQAQAGDAGKQLLHVSSEAEDGAAAADKEVVGEGEGAEGGHANGALGDSGPAADASNPEKAADADGDDDDDDDDSHEGGDDENEAASSSKGGRRGRGGGRGGGRGRGQGRGRGKGRGRGRGGSSVAAAGNATAAKEGSAAQAFSQLRVAAADSKQGQGQGQGAGMNEAGELAALRSRELLMELALESTARVSTSINIGPDGLISLGSPDVGSGVEGAGATVGELGGGAFPAGISAVPGPEPASSADNDSEALPLLLVVSNIEVLAKRDPALLYFLLELSLMAHDGAGRRPRLSLLGMGSGAFLAERLEKRFVSRLAGCTVHMPAPSPEMVAARLAHLLQLPSAGENVYLAAAAAANAAAEAAARQAVGKHPRKREAAVAHIRGILDRQHKIVHRYYSVYWRHWARAVVALVGRPEFALAPAAHPAAAAAGVEVPFAEFVQRAHLAVKSLRLRQQQALEAVRRTVGQAPQADAGAESGTGTGTGGASSSGATADAAKFKLGTGAGAGQAPSTLSTAATAAFPLLQLDDALPVVPRPGASLVASAYAVEGVTGAAAAAQSRAVALPSVPLAGPVAEASLSQVSALSTIELCLLAAMAHIELRDRHKEKDARDKSRLSGAEAAAVASATAAGVSIVMMTAADSGVMSTAVREGGGAHMNFARVYEEMVIGLGGGAAKSGSAVSKAAKVGTGAGAGLSTGSSGAGAGAGAGAGVVAAAGAVAGAAADSVDRANEAADAAEDALSRLVPERDVAVRAWEDLVMCGLVRLVRDSEARSDEASLRRRDIALLEGSASKGTAGGAAAAAASGGRTHPAGYFPMATGTVHWAARGFSSGELCASDLEHSRARLMLDPDELLAFLRGSHGRAVFAGVEATVAAFIGGSGRAVTESV